MRHVKVAQPENPYPLRLLRITLARFRSGIEENTTNDPSSVRYTFQRLVKSLLYVNGTHKGSSFTVLTLLQARRIHSYLFATFFSVSREENSFYMRFP